MVFGRLSEFISRIGPRGRNLGWNLGGQVLPMIAGLIFVPLLIHGIGTARFGFLSLVWVLIGYFSLFDLGIARALTQRVAALDAAGDGDKLRTAVATGMLLIGALALLTVPLLVGFKQTIIDNIVHANPALAEEASRAFIWLVLGVPVVVIAAGVRGLIEGQHRFVAVNLVRTPSGIGMFVAPWLATQVNPTLASITFAVFIVRLLQLGGFVYLARGLLGQAISRLGLDRDEVKLLFGFGLWATISNVISPILVYIDRFVLSNYGNLSDVAYYTTPFDLISRTLFIGTAIQAVMFPIQSAALVKAPHTVGRLMRQNYIILIVLFAPLCLLTFVLARPGLELWLGAAFAARSAGVLQILAVGIFTNALTGVCFGMLHAMRRADLAAKIHLVELPIYLVMLVVLVRDYGAAGAALAWTIRVTVDLVVITWVARGQLRKNGVLGAAAGAVA